MFYAQAERTKLDAFKNPRGEFCKVVYAVKSRVLTRLFPGNQVSSYNPEIS